MDATVLLPPFLDAREIARNCAEAQLGAAATQALLNFAQHIVTNPDLCRVISAAHHAVYETQEDDPVALEHADAVVGAEAGVLHALLILDSMRLVRQKHEQRGVPRAITRAVNERHGVAWLRDAIAKRGQVDIPEWIPGWFRTVGSGELYRLGRLEFVLEAWEYPFRVYINVHTHEVIVVAEAGQQFTDDGYLVGPRTWTSTFFESHDAVFGFPISPHGYALRQVVRLPHMEWQMVLRQGDPVLDIHVPAEGRLTLDALRDALGQAVMFFDQYYPQQPFVTYLCDSWLFSPQLEAMLVPTSNILRWQQEGYLLPSEDGSESFLTFTFGSATIDLATAPQDTRLRRAVIAHLAENRPLCCGSWLLLRRDREQFGTQPYRQASERAITHLIGE
jgi:hypothetical protein